MENESQIIADKKPNKLYALYERFLKIRGTPHEIALGFALGIFVGSTPFFGFHVIMVLFLAAGLKSNKISGIAGVQITNIFTAPIYYSLTYIVGAKCIGLQNGFHLPIKFEFATILTWIETAPHILWALIVGGIIVGIPLALISYYVIFFMFKEYQEKIKPKIKPKLALANKNNKTKRKKQKNKK